MKELYEKYKNENAYSIILIKSGSFYVTYDTDALILSELFNYQVIKNKVGFPLKSIDKVVNKFIEMNLNYLIYDSDGITSNKYENNAYNSMLKDIKKRQYKDSMKKLLFDRIEELLNENDENYDKIRRFIDGL